MARSARNYESSQHPYNQMDFVVRRILTDVHTGLPCRVLECFPMEPGEARANAEGITGLVNVELMIDQIDNEEKTIETQPIYNVPYQRLQAGMCAIVLDPKPGDIGWLSFGERDISTFKKTREKAQPASHRMLTQSDCVYKPGILNDPPRIWIRLREDGIVIEGDNRPITVHSKTAINLDAPEVNISGDVKVEQDVFAECLGRNVSLAHHKNKDVVPGPALTGEPAP